jgi:hypothetical protein
MGIKEYVQTLGMLMFDRPMLENGDIHPKLAQKIVRIKLQLFALRDLQHYDETFIILLAIGLSNSNVLLMPVM